MWGFGYENSEDIFIDNSLIIKNIHVEYMFPMK